MANELTRILDVITPEIFNTYMDQYSTEKSALIQSGVAVSDERVSKNITAGGTLVNMPFWNDLSGEDESLDDGETGLSTGKITASADVAGVMYRGKGWSVNELAAVISGDDPMRALLNKVGDFWLRREQQVLISVLNGLFAPTSGALTSGDYKHLNTTAASIDASAILDTKQLLGDAADKLSLLAMHSATFTQLQKQNLIDFIPQSESKIAIPTYLGYRVIVDDGIKPVDGKYTTYLMATGAIGRNTGNPAALTTFEKARDAAKGNDNIFTRRAFTMHPYGVKWLNATVSAKTPTNSDLATATNWKPVYESKNIGIVALQHTLGTTAPTV